MKGAAYGLTLGLDLRAAKRRFMAELIDIRDRPLEGWRKPETV